MQYGYNSNNSNSGKTTNPLIFGKVTQRLLQAVPLGVITFDNHFNITDSNAIANELLELTEENNNIVRILLQGAAQGEKPDWAQELTQAIAGTESKIFDNFAYNKNGVNRFLHVVCAPLISEDEQKSNGGLLLIEDITSKIMMEKDLASAERLAAMGKLAAKVAHELNNPLDGILRYINMSLRLVEQAGPQQAVKFLKESHKGLLRMVQIISELLEFSRTTYSAMENADINKIVEEAVKAMQSLADSKYIKIERHYSKDMPNIRSGNLFQVFTNLIKNAIDAMEQNGQLDITTYCDEHNSVIEFADTGTGLTPEQQEKIFEPFFTTKPTGKGTGLGLAICKEIMERYNGKITAKNRPEGGSVFTVTIPLQ